MQNIAVKHNHVKKTTLSFLHINSETIIRNLNSKSKIILNNISNSSFSNQILTFLLIFSNQVLTSFSTQKQISIFRTKNFLLSAASENKNQISLLILNQNIRQKVRNMKAVKNIKAVKNKKIFNLNRK